MTRLLVLGAGVSGLAASRLAVSEGSRVTIFDERSDAVGPIMLSGAAAITGAWDPVALEGVDTVVASPGFSIRSEAVLDALEAGLEVIGEIEFGFRRLASPVIAVTGTNGKTTVTSLISEMLDRSGLIAPAVGNIGTALSDHVRDRADVLVVEISSFQLSLIDAFHPRTAVVTNVDADHLDWHGSVEAYRAAKARVVERMETEDLVVYDYSDRGAVAVAEAAAARRRPVQVDPPRGGFGVSESGLHMGPVEVPHKELRVRGGVYLTDLALAAAAAFEGGASEAGVRDVATSFTPAPHRRTLVATVNGVMFVDDSKATNPHAARAAIEDFGSVVLIAGGQAKGLDMSPLVEPPGVRHIVAIGDAAALMSALAPDRTSVAEDMEGAVRMAWERALPGDTVLLAPGCASFDMFESYAHRGEVFARAVRKATRGERVT